MISDNSKISESVKDEDEIKISKETKALTGAVVAGLGVPAGVVTTVASIGAASTGTAISTLSGTAATNATLAAIGGGSLATGGGGILLGTALLTGGGIIIALGVGFGIWKYLTGNDNTLVKPDLKFIPEKLDRSISNRQQGSS
ncbi:hypothetical protein MWU50_10240 [Flavobacteriaceae bacterium S0862]|nr:hypothetical protein [Flavobacteriaceae bacterium S0862]